MTDVLDIVFDDERHLGRQLQDHLFTQWRRFREEIQISENCEFRKYYLISYNGCGWFNSNLSLFNQLKTDANNQVGSYNHFLDENLKRGLIKTQISIRPFAGALIFHLTV